MKKVCVSILAIFVLIGVQSLPTFADDSTKNIAVKNIILTKSKLQKTKIGKKYMQAFDSFVQTASQEKLEKVEKNIQKIIASGSLTPESKMHNVIMYLHYKIQHKLSEKPLAESLAEKTEKEQTIIKKEPIKTEVPAQPAETFEKVDAIEKNKIKGELLQLQKHLLANPREILVNISKDIQKNLNVEERGNFELMLNLDYKQAGSLNYMLQLKDYIAKSNSHFNSSFKANIHSDLELKAKEQKQATQLEFSGDIEHISKDGETYIGLNNLDISKQNNLNSSMEGFVKTLQKIANKNTFVKVTESNYDTKKITAFLQQINPKNIDTQLEKVSTTAMFEVYGKTEKGYLLQPTPFACDILAKTFNVFGTDRQSCSEKEYQMLAQALKTSGTLYLQVEGDSKVLKFDGNLDGTIVLGKIAYNSSKVTSVDFHAEPTSKSFKGEFITLKYKESDSLMFKSNFSGGNITIDFDSKLDQNNRFSFADLKFNDKDNGNTIYAKLENNYITGNFEVLTRGYNYHNDNWKKIDKYKTTGTISGRTKNDNSLSNVDIHISGTDLIKNKKDLSGNISLTDDIFKLLLNKETKGEKFLFDLSYNYDKNYLPVNGDIKLQFWKKESSLNYNTYKTTYTGDFKKVFDSHINIKSKTISGTTIIPEYVTIQHQGFISKEKFELKNDYKFESKSIEMLNMMQDRSSINNTIRKSNLKTLQLALEMYHNDNGSYPGKIEMTSQDFKSLLRSIPKDPLGNVKIDNCKFGYRYQVGLKNGVENQAYKLSACLEGDKNIYTLSNTKDFQVTEDFYINGYTDWNMRTSDSTKDQIKTLQGMFNFKSETSETKNKLDVYFSLLIDDKEVVDFKLKNNANKRKTDYIEIQAPASYIRVDEVFK